MSLSGSATQPPAWSVLALPYHRYVDDPRDADTDTHRDHPGAAHPDRDADARSAGHSDCTDSDADACAGAVNLKR